MAYLSRKTESSLDKLRRESTHVRDYLLRIEGQDCLALVSALRPFDNKPFDYEDEGKNQTFSDDEVNELSRAFQEAYDNALATVDTYTLNEVLSGRSPHRSKHHTLSSPLLAIIGFVLVVGAFHFSYWSNRATFVIQEAQEFVKFDHFGAMMQLVELENYFAQSAGDTPNGDLEPQLVYLEQFSALKTQYHSEELLPQRMHELREDFNPITKWRSAAQDRYCGTDSAWAPFLACPEISDIQTVHMRTDNLPDDPAAALEGSAIDSSFRESLSQIARIELATMQAAGREASSTYAQSRYSVIARMQELQERLNIVHLWALPIIYGALGSIVYCMWRILNTNVSALSLSYSVLRTVFAGLAALTFSMLLVPSNILTLTVDLNRPLIYLLSFIFGYSIEAFVNTLNMINTYASANLQARKRKTG
ncbi:hypothetical protein SLH49_11775 [Cognatiyoonia sp. IB215446]|uniref:hypothetical protein n=1 Tax=Cognatiyoonia sp. IB215446 TaxID=3097355 RepID=UPI002A17628E|nr:hypothetical protein [Cognatiyoonia sp. IB215446]MDX8348659.1 hypothetical protein [Cognatiyoonia sp. IB215446]